MAKAKFNKIQYISSAEVFDNRPFAKQELENSGEFSYGDNDLSLVSRDKLIKVLEGLKLDYGDEEADVDACVAFLKTLPATIYIDLEDM